MGLDQPYIKKIPAKSKIAGTFSGAAESGTKAPNQAAAGGPEPQATGQASVVKPETQAVFKQKPARAHSHHPVFFPFPGPVSSVRDQKVSGPADGNGAPDHGNAETGSAGHGDDDADGQVDQVGDGEHDHITGTSQETVYGHFKTDHTEEPSHESEVIFSRQEGFCGAVCTKEKSDQWMMEAFHTDAQDDSTEDDHPDSSMIAFYNTVRLSGAQILCSVGRDRISNA